MKKSQIFKMTQMLITHFF